MNRPSLCFIVLLCVAPHEAVLAHAACGLDASPYLTESILKGLVNPPRDSSNPSRQLVLVVAHRGDWRTAGENSIKSVEFATEAGIELIEIDVRLSQDGVAYLLHDHKLDRTTTGTGYITERSSAYVAPLRVRDRHGKPTDETIPTFASLLGYYYNEFTCVGDAGEMRGPALIVDVKGGHGSTTYLNLRPVVDVARQSYGVFAGAGLVFKVKAKDLPPDPETLEDNLGWSGTVRDPGQNLILVLHPDDPTTAADPSKDTKFMAYVSKPYVLGFELNHAYKGDKMQPYIDYLKTKAAPPQLGGKSPRTIMLYLQDNFFPEGVAKADATCCYLANTDLTQVTPERPLDYRGRIELFGGRADLVTVDRLSDILNYLETMGRRDLTLISN